jgi:hypothetical protein
MDIKVCLSFPLLYPAQAFFKSADLPDLSTDLARSATMHEIPNLPFPSLHEPEQTTTQQAGAQQPEPKEATGSRKAESED